VLFSRATSRFQYRYFASIVSANVAIAAPARGGGRGRALVRHSGVSRDGGKRRRLCEEVQAPGQSLIAFDPARSEVWTRSGPADDQSARRARRVFTCLSRSTRHTISLSTLSRNSIGEPPVLMA
jgi:hypothetical protein